VGDAGNAVVKIVVPDDTQSQTLKNSLYENVPHDVKNNKIINFLVELILKENYIELKPGKMTGAVTNSKGEINYNELQSHTNISKGIINSYICNYFNECNKKRNPEGKICNLNQIKLYDNTTNLLIYPNDTALSYLLNKIMEKSCSALDCKNKASTKINLIKKVQEFIDNGGLLTDKTSEEKRELTCNNTSQNTNTHASPSNGTRASSSNASNGTRVSASNASNNTHASANGRTSTRTSVSNASNNTHASSNGSRTSVSNNSRASSSNGSRASVSNVKKK
jgi:hypothetical protein